jgi:hypothetical protein
MLWHFGSISMDVSHTLDMPGPLSVNQLKHNSYRYLYDIRICNNE